MAKEFVVYSKTKAKFEAQVASGEVDNTQIGIIAESGEFWEKGNYHPLVMLTDYLKKTDAVALAKDLTGVLEATPEEFTFRPSAGTKSIRDESAVIRRIKGNTSVWGQLLGEMNADNWNQHSATYTDIEYLENGCKITISPTYAGGNVYQLGIRYKPTVTHYVSGHKYMVIFDANVEVSGQMAVETNGSTYYSPRIEAGQWNTTFVTFTRNGTVNNFYFKPPGGYQTTASVGKTYSVRNAMLFDLTALYEAVNEPTTLEEFKKLYPESYYPYCEPEVRSMRAAGIETIGFNAFNGEYAEVLGDMQYCLCGDFTSIGFSDTIGGDITDITIPEDGIYTPPKRGYIYASGTNICIHLVHSGVCNGEYHDYWKSMRTLPDIAKYFPEGMHGIGGVFDEINEVNVVKRFGVRAYEDGDNDNADVMTDGTNTVYVLAEPIVTPITEPLQWDCKVADFGTEKMLSDLPSSPFRADIVYQFNAEGRIRDNSRNIERLEEYTKNMATMEDVLNAIPTEVATATQKSGGLSVSGNISISPNIMYEYNAGLGEFSSFVLPMLYMPSGDYDYVWMLRLPSIATSSILSYPYAIKWKDGVAPTFSEPCSLEIYLKKIGTGEIIGEWKIYR